MADDVFADGREAERLLADPVFKKALERMEAQYVESWKISDSPAKREHFHACVKAVNDLRAQLEAMKTNRAIAVAEDKKFGRSRKGD